MGLLVRPAGRTSYTDQLDGPAERTSWTDQFLLFEALACLHVQRFFFQFVHCCSLRVRRRPCLNLIIRILHCKVQTCSQHCQCSGNCQTCPSLIYPCRTCPYSNWSLVLTCPVYALQTKYGALCG